MADPKTVLSGIHIAHCCKDHGCKYGNPACPVVLGFAVQKYPCEDCAPDAAFEAQQKPEPVYTTRDTHSVVFTPVGYIAVAPDDHAEMVRKSDLYNDLKAVIERLSYELEDLKKRFV